MEEESFMRRQKKCPYCGQWYTPHPQNYRRQKACSNPECQAQRARKAVDRWHVKNPTYDDGREAYYQQWREENPGYWRERRARDKRYEKRNREQQRRRDRKKRNLAKRNDWKSLHVEKLQRIRHLGHLAKRNDCGVPVTRQTEEICRYLEWSQISCQTKR